MAKNDEEYSIRETQVLGRDTTTVGLFGWTFPDMGIVAATFIMTRWITQNTMATMVMTALAVIWVKKLKDRLPERFLSKYLTYNLTAGSHGIFRALGRDTQWRPPLVANKAGNPVSLLWEEMTSPPSVPGETPGNKKRAS